MASQLAIELSLAQESEAIFVANPGSATGLTPTYQVSNFNMIPEILEFDGKNFSLLIFKLPMTLCF